MISRDQPAFGSIIQFPGDTQNAARQLNLDMEATNRAVEGGNVSSAALTNWRAFYTAWLIYFKPIDDAWSFNPLGAAAFADQADIEDWRKRLRVQQDMLKSAGAAEGSLPVSLDRNPSNPLAPLTDVLGEAKWVVLGGLALYLLVTFAPRPKRK